MTNPAIGTWLSNHGLDMSDLKEWRIERDEDCLCIPVSAGNGEHAFDLVRNFSGVRYDKPVGRHPAFVLYGLDRAREFIADGQGLLIVEGFSDCLALHKAGFKNTVSILGSYMSLTQWALATTVVGPDEYCAIWLDGDETGITHAIRLAQELERHPHPVHTITATVDGYDPAELWAKDTRTGRGVRAAENHIAVYSLYQEHPLAYLAMEGSRAKVNQAKSLPYVNNRLNDPRFSRKS